MMEGSGALMIVLLAAALVGGLMSFAVLWPYGALAALVGAQFGATFLALTAGLLLALLKSKVELKQNGAFRPSRVIVEP
jgi:hypothetical protein